MMRDGWFAPTINLDNIDERCGKLDYIQGDGRHIETDYVMNNNFAFGGVNTSLIFKRWQAWFKQLLKICVDIVIYQTSWQPASYAQNIYFSKVYHF